MNIRYDKHQIYMDTREIQLKLSVSNGYYFEDVLVTWKYAQERWTIIDVSCRDTNGTIFKVCQAVLTKAKKYEYENCGLMTIDWLAERTKEVILQNIDDELVSSSK